MKLHIDKVPESLIAYLVLEKDGEELRDAFAADEEAGTAQCYVFTEGTIAEITVTGKMAFRLLPDATPAAIAAYEALRAP